MLKNGWDLLDHEILKSEFLPKWFDQLSRLNERYLDADTDGIIFRLIAIYSVIFTLNAAVPLQLDLFRMMFCF